MIRRSAILSAGALRNCKRAGLSSPSRPGGFHPEPLTDPDLNLSIHPARAISERAAALRQNRGLLLSPVDPLRFQRRWPARFAPRTLLRFLATTRQSAPQHRIRTLALVVHATCGFPVSIGTEGSHVPNNRLTRAQATYMPDTVPPVNRRRRNLSRGLLTNHGFDIV